MACRCAKGEGAAPAADPKIEREGLVPFKLLDVVPDVAWQPEAFAGLQHALKAARACKRGELADVGPLHIDHRKGVSGVAGRERVELGSLGWDEEEEPLATAHLPVAGATGPCSQQRSSQQRSSPWAAHESQHERGEGQRRTPRVT